MKFTDFFIRRPVFAIVLSLLLLVFGLRALTDLQVRQYPDMEIGQLNIVTAYPGADARLVQGFVTTPIQETINSVEGIDYIKASSRPGVSMIEVFLELGYDVNIAMAEMLSKINEIQGRLPGSQRCHYWSLYPPLQQALQFAESSSRTHRTLIIPAI